MGQVGALIAFFAFPALQYWGLRKISRNDGKAELWYLPAYGFRLVIRNLPKRHTLVGIRYRALLRTVIPGGDGASVATFQDEPLLARDDFFLFAGTDQVIVSFKLEPDVQEQLTFVYTDKLGNHLRTLHVDDRTRLIADFTATIKNWFNFDVSIARRVEIDGKRLAEIAAAIRDSNEEQEFAVTRVRDVG